VAAFQSDLWDWFSLCRLCGSRVPFRVINISLAIIFVGQEVLFSDLESALLDSELQIFVHLCHGCKYTVRSRRGSILCACSRCKSIRP
jgi:hypothetical protein